jgi:hypothetical protein
MARGNAQADQGAKSGLANSNNLSAASSANYATLMPELQAQMAHPAGFSQPDLSAMETASEQTEGGAAGGAAGQGALLASRMKNPGTASAAVAQSARNAGEQLSKNSLGIRTANAGLKEQQREGAQNGLEGLYNTGVSGSNQALGETANNVNANTNAENASWNWARYILDPMISGGSQVGAAALAGCWIAEAIYGTDDVRTHVVRAYLNGEFKQTLIGGLVMRFYMAFGQRIAGLARRSKLLRRSLKPLFDFALHAAIAGAE